MNSENKNTNTTGRRSVSPSDRRMVGTTGSAGRGTTGTGTRTKSTGSTSSTRASVKENTAGATGNQTSNKKPSKTQIRRRARKTLAAALLVSSVLVASIPIPETSAATTTAGDKTKINIEYENWHHVAQTSVSEQAHIDYPSSTAAFIHSDPDGTMFPKVEKKEEYTSSKKTVEVNEQVYISEDGMFRFVYHKPTATYDNPVAIIVGCSLSSLGSGGNLVIPETVNGYITYNTAQGTTSGNVAATQDGKPLFYKYATKITRTVTTFENGSTPAAQIETDSPVLVTELNQNTLNASTVSKDNYETQVVAGVETSVKVSTTYTYTYYTYTFNPCYSTSTQMAIWDKDNVLYYECSSTGTPDSTKSYVSSSTMAWFTTDSVYDSTYISANFTVDPGWYSTTDQRMVNADVMYVASEVVSYETDPVTKQVTWYVTESTKDSSVFGHNSNIQNLTIPRSIKGVGKFAFYYNTGMKTVTFDDQIQVIGQSAFEYCTSLTTVNLGENANVNIIEQAAFKSCNRLERFQVPKAVNYIGDNAFWGDYSLKTLDFSTADTLAGIGNDAFYGCYGLSTVDMTGATSLNQIGCHLFAGCTDLREVIFPVSLQNSKFVAVKIPISIFQGCNKLKHIQIPNKYMTFCDDVYNAANYKLGIYTIADGKYTVNSGATIGGDATAEQYYYSLGSFFDETSGNGFYFEGYEESKIHELTQANEVAFKYMDEGMDGKYEKVMLCPEVTDKTGKTRKTGPDVNDYDQDGDTSEIVQQYVPTVFMVNASGELVSVNILNSADNSKFYELEIPSAIGPYNITSIGSNFQGNEHITKATIPDTITVIAAEAFKGCYYLNRVVFDDPIGITSIGGNAFQTQMRSDNNVGGAPNSENLVELTFEGPIDEASLPFQYAMASGNNINNTSQSTSYIDCYTGVPTNLHVKYNPDTRKSELQSVPLFFPDSASTPVKKEMMVAPTSAVPNPNYEFCQSVRQALIDEGVLPASAVDAGVTEDQYNLITANWINQAILYYNGSDAKKVNNSTGALTGDTYVPSQLTVDTLDSVYHVVIPSGVQTLKKNLFSKGSDFTTYDATDTDFKTKNLTIYKNTGSKVNSDNIPLLTGAFDHMGTQTGKYTDNATEEREYKNTVMKTLVLNSIEYIDPYAFYGLPELTSLTMYNSAAGSETIGDYAFAYCDKLAEVTLPSSTESMGLRPFAGDRMLTDINFSASSASNSKSESGDNFSYSNGIVYETEGGAKKAIVECLETRYNKTQDEASVGGAAVTSSEVSGISEMYDEAFMNTNVLTVDLSSAAIKEVPSLCFAYEKDYPAKNGTSKAAAGSSSLNTVLLPSTCTTIRAHAFYNTGLANITMPSSVVIINPYAFSNDATEVDTYVTVSATEGSVAYQQALDYAKYFWTLGDPPAETFTVKFYDGFEDADTLVYTDYVVAGNDADTAAAEAALPTHDGYVFSKWKPSPTGVSEHMNTYALWTEAAAQTYTVTFYDWDLTVLAERSVSYGGDAEEPKSPTRSGYTFTGWTKGFTNVTENIQTMAVYTPNGSSTDSGSSGGSSSGGSSSGGSSSGGSSSGTSGSSSSGSSGSSSSSSGSSGSSSSGSGGSNNGADLTTYTLTVINGSGSGSYVAGTTVLISAYTPSTGYTFDKWTSTVETTAFTNAEAYTTTLTMPASSTTVTANYLTSEGKSTSDRKSNSGSGTSKNSGSGSGTVSGNDSGSTTTPNSGSNSGTTVDVSKDGISDKDVASATVNGSTDDFTVKIREDADATLAVATALKNRYGSLDDIRYVAMDISLYDESGTKKITDTAGLAVTVTIPIPDELRKYAGNNKVGAVIGNYELDQLTPTFSTINGVPTVTFTATHFSPYTVYVNLQNLSDGTITDDTPKTGDMLHPKWFLAIGLALASAVLFLKKDKKVTVKTA